MAAEITGNEKNLCLRRLDPVPTATDLLPPFSMKRALLLAPVVSEMELLVWDPARSWIYLHRGRIQCPLPRICRRRARGALGSGDLAFVGLVHGSSHRHAICCGSPALEAEL
jgi:hypothetical protein